MVYSFLHRIYIKNRHHIPITEDSNPAYPFRGSDKSAQRFHNYFLLAFDSINWNAAFPFMVLDYNKNLTPVRAPDHFIKPEDLEHFIPDHGHFTVPDTVHAILPEVCHFYNTADWYCQALVIDPDNHHVNNRHGGRKKEFKSAPVTRSCLHINGTFERFDRPLHHVETNTSPRYVRDGIRGGKTRLEEQIDGLIGRKGCSDLHGNQPFIYGFFLDLLYIDAGAVVNQFDDHIIPVAVC